MLNGFRRSLVRHEFRRPQSRERNEVTSPLITLDQNQYYRDTSSMVIPNTPEDSTSWLRLNFQSQARVSQAFCYPTRFREDGGRLRGVQQHNLDWCDIGLQEEPLRVA